MSVTGFQASQPPRTLATVSEPIRAAAQALGPGPLSEEALRAHIAPLFSRVLASPGIYLANHSLGRPLNQTADDIREFADLWYRDMDDAWGPWLNEINAFRARLAVLCGLERADAVVPKSSAGAAFRSVLGAVRSGCPRLLATRGEFDSIDFILKVAAARGRAEVHWVEASAGRGEVAVFDEHAIASAISRVRPEIVIVSKICYATGQCLDLGPITAAAHDAGALMVVDAYHAVGVLNFDMEREGYDFAIGGVYKYLRGGPGPCFLAIHPRHLDESMQASSRLMPVDTGWFAKRDTFAFQRPESPEFSDGGDAWLESTPTPVLAFQARAGLQLTLAIGVERLRQYNLAQQSFLAEQLQEHRVPVRELPSRGAYLLVPHPEARALVQHMKSRGVIADARLGHVRLCPDILTTREEMRRASSLIAQAMKQ